MGTIPKVSFVMMLDNSDSMSGVMPLVKIDAKAFIRSTLEGDQFGINTFNTHAAWLYPSGASPQMVTVDAQKEETARAAAAIENINSQGVTNMGEAIDLAQKMMPQATGDRKAFVILTDGYANEGTMPELVYTGSTPLYIAALGKYISESQFQKLKNMNPANQVYYQPSAIDMMKMLNQIRGDVTGAKLLTNSVMPYQGSDYHMEEVLVSEDAPEMQFTVVWSDARCTYTKEVPTGFAMNVYLVDNNNNILRDEPDVKGEGFCIFNKTNVKAGTWRILVQYSVAGGLDISGTLGGFSFIPQIVIQTETPVWNTLGNPVTAGISVMYEGERIKDVSATLKVIRPTAASDDLLKRNSVQEGLAATDNLNALPNARLLHREVKNNLHTSIHFLNNQSPQKALSCAINDTHIPGAYNLEWEIKGRNPRTGKDFRFVKTKTILVG